MKGISTGGFTTFSAFANEGFLMLSSGNLWGFIGYVTSSVILGVTLVASGYSNREIIILFYLFYRMPYQLALPLRSQPRRRNRAGCICSEMEQLSGITEC